MASRHRDRYVGGPDHLVFLPEDKFVHNRQAGRADSTRLLAWVVRGLMRRLDTQVETMLVLIA